MKTTDIEQNGTRRIAIVIEIFAAPDEKGYSRFRTIAEYFCKSGYSVDVLCSDFIHADKTHREVGLIESMNLPYHVIEFHEPGYKKNISLERILSQYTFAKKLKEYFSSHMGEYDCVYSTMPDNYVAKIATDYANANNIPIVIDVEDLLPEGFKQVFDVPLLSDLLFLPWWLTAESVYRRVDGVIGSSNEYRNRPFLHSKRSIPRDTVYVGIDLDYFDCCARRSIDSFVKPPGEFWITYTGTIGTSYDLQTPICAVSLLHDVGIDNVVFKIAGDGPLSRELKELSESISGKVDFLGYLSYSDMASLLCASDIAVNSFAAKAPQSIVNKVGDYLGGGCPIVNTCPSQEFRDLVDFEEVGINALPESPCDVATAIEILYRNDGLRLRMAQNARQLAQKSFNRAETYPRIIRMMDNLIEE